MPERTITLTPNGKAAKCSRCAVTVDLDEIELPNRCHKNCPLDAWWAQQKQQGAAA
jgi:hypothetical protein